MKRKSREANPEKQAQNEQNLQKHAQYAFSSKLKQQKRHKIWKKAIGKTEICKKQANFN